MATSLGGVTLANPAVGREGYVRTEIDIGATHSMADGSTVLDFVADRFRHRLQWNGITAAQRNTIKTQFDAAKAASSAFVTPDAGAYTVLAVMSSYTDDYVLDGGGTARYYVGLELEDTGVEVS